MRLYIIHHKGDYSNPSTFEAVTNNFEKWLEEHNKTRLQENNNDADFIEDADDFEVEEIYPFLYREEK
jgi:hypothetical protein